MILDGSAHPLVMLGKERSKVFPDVPTIVEAGYPDAVADIWWGVFGPKGMSDELVAKIHDDIATVVSSPELVEMFKKQGAKPATLPQAEFVTLVNYELDRWKVLAEKYHIVAE